MRCAQFGAPDSISTGVADTGLFNGAFGSGITGGDRIAGATVTT